MSVVSSTFHPRRSYQENLWAEQLAELGAEVTVFSARSKFDEHEEMRSAHRTTLQTPRGMTYQHVELSSHVLPRNQFLTKYLGDALVENKPKTDYLVRLHHVFVVLYTLTQDSQQFQWSRSIV